MAIRIKFDSTHNAQSPTYVLATRSGRKLGKLPAHNITFKDTLNSYSEIFFRINKADCTSDAFWNSVKDFKLMYCREYNMWFEIYVEIDESNNLVKNVTAKSLGEAELSQIILYGIEINTELDISRDDYKPTTLFDEIDPKASLLDRITEKAPHYKITHVDQSIAKIQRTFSFDSVTIYDAFQTISQEINCLFIIKVSSDNDGNICREIEVYDLESYCMECGKRDEFSGSCPECGSENILTGYGKDTTIFVSTDNLASDIQYSTNVDSVKNCFRLVAGDDLMTATLVNCNPNGSGYIWYISDESKEDMSDELVSTLNKYDTVYNYYQKEHTVSIPTNLLTQYNSLVEKYANYSNTISAIPELIVGYPKLMNSYYDTIDMYLFLNNGLMPNVSMQDTTAVQEAVKLNSYNLSPVAVIDLEKVTSASANNAVLSVAKIIVDSRYQVKINESFLDGTVWSGNFTITNYSDEEDTATSEKVIIAINDDYETYVKQKIEKSLNGASDESTDVVAIFNLGDEEFISQIKKYCLSRLVSFNDACQACLDILIEQGIADKDTWANEDPDLYSSIYVPYYNKLSYLSDEIKVRESEIAVVIGTYDRYGEIISDGVQTVLETERDAIQDTLNFEKFLGEELWLEFVAYRREDTYQNDNYISDGLNNAEIFERALQFIEVAKKDIYKSATLQHSITATLKNLLVMKEFAAIVNYFEVGNWIRVRVGGEVYKLRIIDFEIDYDNLENISIVFSDVKSGADGISDAESIMNQAASMATSFDSIKRQSKQGKEARNTIDDWLKDGLNSSLIQIQNNNTEDITFTKNGLLCRSYNDITETYSNEQLKITHNIIAYTDDDWKTVNFAIGKHNYATYVPSSDSWITLTDYGLSAKFVTAGQVMGSKIVGGEIFSSNYHKGEKDSTTNSPSGSYFDLTTGNFELGGRKIIFDGSELVLDGVTIYATGGQIGGCNIADGKLIIPAANITGTLTATNIKLHNLFEVRSTNASGGGFLGGYLGYSSGALDNGMVTDGIAMMNSNKDCYVITTSEGARMQVGNSDIHITKSSGIIVLNGAVSARQMMQRGTASIKPTAVNTPTSIHITFNTVFSDIPAVVACPNTAFPGTGVLGVGVMNVTSSGFDLYLTRADDTTSTSVFWIAIDTKDE